MLGWRRVPAAKRLVNMRILLGWELGAGLGHVNRLKVVADRLRADGAEISVALQDLRRADIFTDAGYSVVQGPVWKMPTDPALRKIPTHSFADVLKIIGLANDQALAARIDGWRGLFDLARPDLVIGDFAPALTLAARGRRPMISVGNGYMTPPAGRAMPPIRPWVKDRDLPATSRAAETELLALVNRVAAAKGAPTLNFLADLFNGDRTFVVTASITDPYRAYREAPTLLPFNMPRGIHPRPLADRRPKGVFLYLPSGHPAVRNIVYGLRGAGLDCDAYLSDLPAASIEKLTGPGFRVHARPVSFAKMLPEVRLVVHYAGLSTAIAAAKAGTPQLIAPWNLEHAVTARGVADAVGARLIADDASTAVVGKTARAMIDDDRLAARALAGADMFPDHDPAPTLDRIAAACKELAG